MLTEEQQPRTEPTSAPAQREGVARRYVWWLVAALIIAVAFLIVRWAGTRPGYDPYGWLIWGYQAVHLNLDLGGAPSWKPLTLLFTTPYALFGHTAQLWLWMTTAVAATLAGSLFAGRIAFRVVSRGRGWAGPYRWAALAAAVFAAVGMYGIQDNINGTLSSYVHYVLSVQSDPMIVSMVLAAIDFHMTRHRNWAIAMLWLGSLGRPEVWPILFLYSIWCWRRHPGTRWAIAAAWVLLVFMWFGIPTLTNGRPLVAGDLAQGSPRELHENKVVGTIDRFKTLNLWPVWVLALVAVAWSGWRLRALGGLRLRESLGWLLPERWAARPGPDDDDAAPRERTIHLLVLGLLVCVLIWLVVEVAFALHGWPAVPRYIFEPATVAILLGAIGFGWVLTEIPRRVHVPAWAGLIVAVGLTVALVPGAHARISNEHKDLYHERQRTVEVNHLQGFLNRLGGYMAVRDCGRPVVNVEYVSIMGWDTHLNDGKVGHRPLFELHQHYPIVLFTPLPNGWAAYPWHTRSSMVSTCQRMKALYIFTSHHPNGEIVPNHTPPKPGG